MGGYREITELILEYCADMGTEDGRPATPPYGDRDLAADNEMGDAARVPPKHGAVHIRDNQGFTALHDAAWQGDANVVLLLLRFGADLEAQNSDDDTPLHLAVYHGKLEAARVILKLARGAIVLVKNKLGRTPLHGAGMGTNGNPDITRLLLEHQLPPRPSAVHIQDNQGWSPLHDASWNGYYDVVRLLLQYGADKMSKSGNNDTPLHLAAYQGHLATAQVLLENGTDVHVQNEARQTPLHAAVSSGHRNIAQLLLRHFKTMEAEGSSKALQNEDHEAVQVLLEQHVVHARDDQGFTPLHEATWKGHHDIMLLLLLTGVQRALGDTG
jgi:ankyrin repeat protein